MKDLNLPKEKGITILALTITIIILLILADPHIFLNTNISRPSYIFEYTTINENHLQFEYVVFLMYNSNMAKGR